ncbi:MAG: TonB-dependent receptor [Bacteroidaceae bacterium]|nr:TonB-dependent receptor [Bacteroidaceae bacterium]
MFKRQMKLKAAAICWHQFTRRHDAIFRSLGKEIRIGVLSVSTLTFAAPQNATAQTAMRSTQEQSEEGIRLDEAEIVASRVPLPLEQAARIVSVMTREQLRDCPAQSVNDLLKYAAGVDVRQCGGFGLQTDIGINGGTHDQIVLLLNGVYFSSPHTGHLAADFPFNIDDIERIEILEGAASRVYGTSAFSGAINIVTRQKPSKPLDGTVTLQSGSYGTASMEGSVRMGKYSFYSNLSAGYRRSDGATENSDFSRLNAYYNGGTATQEADFRWQAGVSRQQFGANTFYSGKFPDQYEENSRYHLGITAQTKGRIQFAPTAYWQRSLDHYQLVRGLSPKQENYHQTDVYGLNLHAQTQWTAGITALGAELRSEGILSTALGQPLDNNKYVDIPCSDRQYTRKDQRTNVCYYLEHDVLLKKVTISLGLMANMNTGQDHRYRLYPGVDVSYRPIPRLTLFASWNMAQRMPTFTDLYYKSPTQVGYADLQPERSNEFSLSARLRTTGLEATLRAYHRHETDMIDWVIPADSVTKYGRGQYTTYHATNLSINNMGVAATASVKFPELWGEHSILRDLTLQYSYIHQVRHDDVDIDDSYYGLNYLRHKLVASLTLRPMRRLTATLTYRLQDRRGTYYEYDADHPTLNALGWQTYPFLQKTHYTPFTLLDLRLQWTARRYELFAQLNNLTAHRYVDFGNVPQPGFWFMGGVKVKF